MLLGIHWGSWYYTAVEPVAIGAMGLAVDKVGVSVKKA